MNKFFDLREFLIFILKKIKVFIVCTLLFTLLWMGARTIPLVTQYVTYNEPTTSEGNEELDVYKRQDEHGWMLDLYRHWGIQDGPSMEMVARRYVERLVGCVENVTNEKCQLPKEEDVYKRQL